MDRKEKAKELFMQGYNCSQAVVGAYCDLFGMSFKDGVCMAEGMGGGMGRMRLTCGAVSAMALLAGLKYGTGEPKDIKTRTLIYETVQKMTEEFKSEAGTVICAELLGKDMAGSGAVPQKRDETYFKKRPCVQCVYDCAEIVGKYLLD